MINDFKDIYTSCVKFLIKSFISTTMYVCMYVRMWFSFHIFNSLVSTNKKVLAKHIIQKVIKNIRVASFCFDDPLNTSFFLPLIFVLCLILSNKFSRHICLVYFFIVLFAFNFSTTFRHSIFCFYKIFTLLPYFCINPLNRPLCIRSLINLYVHKKFDICVLLDCSRCIILQTL